MEVNAPFFVDSITYGFVLEKPNLVAVYQSYTAPNPVSPLTDWPRWYQFAIN